MASPIVVVGGGWAGQAAAVELAHLGHPVTLMLVASVSSNWLGTP